MIHPATMQQLSRALTSERISRAEWLRQGRESESIPERLRGPGTHHRVGAERIPARARCPRQARASRLQRTRVLTPDRRGGAHAGHRH